jgi:hypothetical protein
MMEIPQAMNGTRYTFAATQFDHRAYGWVSPKQNIGWWLVQPGVDYMSGGPTKDSRINNLTNYTGPATLQTCRMRLSSNGFDANSSRCGHG